MAACRGQPNLTFWRRANLQVRDVLPWTLYIYIMQRSATVCTCCLLQSTEQSNAMTPNLWHIQMALKMMHYYSMVDRIRRIPTTIQFKIFLITYIIRKNLQMKIKNYKISWYFMRMLKWVFRGGDIDCKRLETKAEENTGFYEGRSNSGLQEIALGAS